MVMIMTMLDLLSLVAVIKFIKLNTEFNLLKEKSFSIDFILILFLINWILKLILMYAGAVLFASEQLFEHSSTLVIVVCLSATICYITAKDYNAIGRTAEIFIIPIIIILIVNLVFIKTDIEFEKNFPILTDNFFILVKSAFKYSLWFGDMTPFIFVIVKELKVKNILIMAGVLLSFIFISYFLMNAIYGNAVQYLENFIVKIAGLNAFSEVIGRLEWTGILAWINISVLYLSILLNAVVEVISRYTKHRIAVILIFITVMSVYEIVFRSTKYVRNFVVTYYSVYAAFTNWILPFILLFVSYGMIYKKYRGAKNAKKIKT